MPLNCVLTTGALAAGLAFALPAIAADKHETVKFGAGKNSATLSGSLKGYDAVVYGIGANAGQAMTVSFSPSNLSCYFNVTAPGSETALFVGAESGNEYAGMLPASGDYVVRVYLMRNAARRGETCDFRITFKVTG